MTDPAKLSVKVYQQSMFNIILFTSQNSLRHGSEWE